MNEILTEKDAREVLSKEMNLEPLIEAASNIIVSDEASFKQALSMSLQTRKLKASIEKTRLSIVRPHTDFQRAVNKLATEFKAKLVEIEQSLSNKLLIFSKQSANKDMFELLKVSVEDGTCKGTVEYIYDIEDISLVPKEYLSISVDDKKIKEAIKAGIRKIPGLNIKESMEINLRVKNESNTAK